MGTSFPADAIFLSGPAHGSWKQTAQRIFTWLQWQCCDNLKRKGVCLPALGLSPKKPNKGRAPLLAAATSCSGPTCVKWGATKFRTVMEGHLKLKKVGNKCSKLLLERGIVVSTTRALLTLLQNSQGRILFHRGGQGTEVVRVQRGAGVQTHLCAQHFLVAKCSFLCDQQVGFCGMVFGGAHYLYR